MGWLTKEERQTLDRDERKQLRRERKDAATEAGERWWQKLGDSLQEAFQGIVINKDLLDDLIVEAIVETRDLPLSRYERISEIIDIAVDKYDKYTDLSKVTIQLGPFPVPVGIALEKYDGPILRFALRGIIVDLILARLDDEDAPSVTLD